MEWGKKEERERRGGEKEGVGDDRGGRAHAAVGHSARDGTAERKRRLAGKEGRSVAAAENRGKKKREEKGKEGERDRSTVKLGYTRLSSNDGKGFEKDFIG